MKPTIYACLYCRCRVNQGSLLCCAKCLAKLLKGPVK